MKRLPDLRGVSILLVEDHVDTREALAEMLARSGAMVLTAGSTGDALRILREVLPAIVVTELTLVEGNGLRLVSELRALGGRTVTPIIALREASPENGGVGRANGDFAVTLGKPVEPFDLCEVVAGLLGDAPHLPGQIPDRDQLH